VSAAFCDDPKNTGSCVLQPAQNIFYQLLVDGSKLNSTLQSEPSVYFRLPVGFFGLGYNFVVLP
jgi:hypothetical protein